LKEKNILIKFPEKKSDKDEIEYLKIGMLLYKDCKKILHENLYEKIISTVIKNDENSKKKLIELWKQFSDVIKFLGKNEKNNFKEIWGKFYFNYFQLK